MIIDGRAVPRGSRLEADLCIIGAGAAGITLARELMDRSLRVVVLESGGDTLDARSRALAEGEIVGLPYFPLEAARLRWLGGSTNHWGGHCRPMEVEDFEPKPWVPFSGWPITRGDLEPYYERARIICGVRTAQWALDDWRGKLRAGPLPLGRRVVTRIAQIVPPGSRSFRIAYRAELNAARNVNVHCWANATEIVTNGAGTLATLVRVATLEGNHYSVAARYVILATGGIENPRLLLASNRQWPRGLGNAHDLVGRFFLEHPRFVGGLLVPSDPRLSLGLYEPHRVGQTKLQGYLSIEKQTRRAEELVDVQISLRPTFPEALERTRSSAPVDDAHELMAAARHYHLDDFGRHLSRVLADLSTWESVMVPGAPLPVPFPEIVGKLMSSTPAAAQALIPDLLGDIIAWGYVRALGAPIEHVLLRTRIDPAPNPDSRVVLASKRDELGMPRARLDWRLSPLDRHSVRRSLEMLGAEVGQAGLGRVRILFSEDGHDWPSDLAGGWHHMGTTRMADDPRHGVVDRACRVHGIHNLYVAGSSVFPTAGSGTPTLTIVALALRLAEHLEEIAA